MHRGVNLTGWFLHPGSRAPAALRAWLSGAAMDDLRHAGVSFVRLAVDPDVVADPPMRALLREQIARLADHGLATVLSIHPVAWHLDTDPADRARLLAFWRGLAPVLRGLPPGMILPEVLNEPVFQDQPALWWDLRGQLRRTIRAALPGVTIVLTATGWDSIGGLLSQPLEPDANVLYSFHFYDPADLTSLAAWRADVDRHAVAGLPFPVTDRAGCDARADQAGDAPTRDLMRFYCATPHDPAARLAEAAAWARAHQVRLLAGEFGASAALNAPARLAWLRLVRRTCETRDIPWAIWGYDDIMGFNVPRPPPFRPVLDRSVLEALGMTIP